MDLTIFFQKSRKVRLPEDRVIGCHDWVTLLIDLLQGYDAFTSYATAMTLSSPSLRIPSEQHARHQSHDSAFTSLSMLTFSRQGCKIPKIPT